MKAATSRRQKRLKRSKELAEVEARHVHEIAEELSHTVPTSLEDHQRVVNLLGLQLAAERTFRVAEVRHPLADGTTFDAGDITILRAGPSVLSREELMHALAATALLRTLRKRLEDLFGLGGTVSDYLSGDVEEHGYLAGRGMNLCERLVVRSGLAEWYRRTPELLSDVSDLVKEIADGAKDTRLNALRNPELRAHRASVYATTIPDAKVVLRSDPWNVTELETWRALFPMGVDTFLAETRSPAP